MGLGLGHREEEPGREVRQPAAAASRGWVLTEQDVRERAADLFTGPAEGQGSGLVAARAQPRVGELTGQGGTRSEGLLEAG